MAVMTKFNLLDPAHVAPNQRGELTPAQRVYVGTLTGFTAAMLVVKASAGVVALGIGVVITLVMLVTRAPAVSYVVAAIFVAIGTALLWTSVRPLLRANQTRQDLNDGRVEQARGEVVWRYGRYVVQAGGRRLGYEAARGNLEPGAYTFYYLPRSGWVVGAEPADGWAGSSEPADLGSTRQVESAAFDLRSVLAQANDFSLLALEANRSGRLGEGQGDRIILTSVGTLLGGVAFAVLGALIGVLVASQQRSPGGDSLAPWIVVAAFVLTGLFLLYRAARLIADATGGRVEMTEGVGRRSRWRSKRSVTYHYHVDKLSFTVSRAAHDALLEDRVYRFYYTPRTKTLVAVEPVEAHQLDT